MTDWTLVRKEIIAFTNFINVAPPTAFEARGILSAAGTWVAQEFGIIFGDQLVPPS